jgi:polyferredoxin
MKKDFLFNKRRYRLLFISVIIIMIGFLLMSGGESNNPEIFSNEIYNFRRIRLAPLVVILGFTLCIITILKKSKN